MKPFDLTKFRKSLTKSIEGIGVGFNDPTDWISTGNYALNYLISGDFYKGIPLGKVTVFAGESGCLPATSHVRIKKDQLIHSVSVAELKQLVTENWKFELLTPDGWQTVSAWWDKGPMNTVVIATESGLETTCATTHLLQNSALQWVPAEDIKVGTKLLTENGYDRVTSITTGTIQDCYDFTVDHPNHRYWGDGFSSHNSGKSYICAGNIIKHAQAQDIYVILIDTENALDEAWLHALGVETSDDKMLKLSMSMIDDVAKTISEFMKEYKELTEQPKVLFVIDSLGMLLTSTDVDQFNKGDLKGDMGRKAKALAALVRNCVNMFGNYNVGMVCTNHTYSSQDPFDPEDKISGGQMFIFASSIVVAIKKLKLKEDEDGNKTSEVHGIRAACKIMKTRYAKPFESVQVKIPYTQGMDPYSGLIELFEKSGHLIKSGNRLKWVDPETSEETLLYQKYWTGDRLEPIMKKFNIKPINKQLIEDIEENVE